MDSRRPAKVSLPDPDAGGKICLQYAASDPFRVGHQYGSIPANLLTNTVVWLALLVLFFIIRKNVMGRLINKTIGRHWTQAMFDKQASSLTEKDSQDVSARDDDDEEEEEDNDPRVAMTEEEDTSPSTSLRPTQTSLSRTYRSCTT